MKNILLPAVIGTALLIPSTVGWADTEQDDSAYSQQESQMNENDSDESESESTTVYTCPMHPEVREMEPGICPLCGMQLEEKTSDEEQTEKMPSNSHEHPATSSEAGVHSHGDNSNHKH
ncbi:MAG: hypothetical protein HYU33_04775 [Candidatus Omnitrophica bacterium]|nr:hypothetical protein [Candidatus Omnitrophota bacterium]